MHVCVRVCMCGHGEERGEGGMEGRRRGRKEGEGGVEGRGRTEVRKEESRDGRRKEGGLGRACSFPGFAIINNGTLGQRQPSCSKNYSVIILCMLVL